MLEALKAGAGNKDGSQMAIFTDIEIRGGNPTSVPNGMASDPYKTSKNMNDASPIPLNDCVALFFLATNIPHNSIPNSTLNGSRAFFLFSSSPDTAGKIDPEHKQNVAAQMDAVSEDEEDDNGAEEYTSGMGHHFLKDSSRSALKEINQSMTRTGCIGYFVHWVLRNAFPFMHRHMMLHYKERQYSWVTLPSFLHDIQEMTRGTWRFHLDDGAFHRNSNASFRTVTYVAMHFKTIVWNSVLMRCNAPAIDRVGNPCVDVNAAFEDALLAARSQPPSITTMLSSMALWLSSQMLDLQLVLVSQLCLYTMGFQKHCPLHVLAVAARHGIAALDKRQREQYYYVADKMIDACCRQHTGQTKQEKQYRDFTIKQGSRFPRKVSFETDSVKPSPVKMSIFSSAALEPLVRNGSCKLAFEEIFGPEKEQHWSHYAAEESKAGKEKTTFCAVKMPDREKCPNKTPLNCLHAMPKWLPYTTSTYNASRRSSEFLSVDDYDSIISEVFASSMSTSSSKARDSENCPMPNTEAFWEAAYKGCKIPLANESGTDKRDLAFMKPSETGAWYLKVLHESSKHRCGTTEAFLAMCGLKSSSSRFQIMTRLFGERLLQRYPSGKTIFPTSKAWTLPWSVDNHLGTGRHKFRFGRRLHIWQTESHEKRTALEAFLMMDALWTVIAQGMYCGEWKVPAKGNAEAVVHTRVLTQAVKAKMELYMHTCLSRSAVPANGGIIHLRLANPFLRKMRKESLDLCFDERVHIEVQEDPGSILSHRHRKRENIHIVRDPENPACRCLVYKQQQEEPASKALTVTGSLGKPGLGLVAMEGCAHMLAHYYEYIAAEQRLRKELPKIFAPDANGVSVQCHIATAIRVLASSMFTVGKPRAVEDSMFLRVTPTYALTCNKLVEMPFVSTKFLYLCVARTLDDGTFVLERVEASSEQILDDEYEKFKPLPSAEKLVFNQEDFSFAVAAGLRHTRHNEVFARMPCQIDGKDGFERETLDANCEEALGLLPFPVAFWPQLVIVTLAGSMCRFHNCSRKRGRDVVEAEGDVMLVQRRCDDLFEEDKAQAFHLEGGAWLRLNQDVPSLPRHMTLHVRRSYTDALFGRKWRFVGFTHAAVENRTEFKHPELVNILRTDGYSTEDKVYMLTAEHWNVLAPLHDGAMLRALHDRHYLHTPDGYWIPETVPDPRMHFWVTWTEMYGDIEQPRFLWFDSRESLKNFCLGGGAVDPGWTCIPWLFVTPDGARLRINRDERDFLVSHVVYTDDAFYRLRQTEDECMDLISEYSKKMDECLAKQQLNNKAVCEQRIREYSDKLSETQAALSQCRPTPTVLGNWEQRDRDVIASEPRVCGMDDVSALSRVVGMLRPHPNGHYLHRGQYHIEYALHDDDLTIESCKLDFVSASYGMVPEGKLLFLSMDANLYISILKNCQGACLLNLENHRRLLNGELDVALACYYSLNSAQDAELLQTHITVMIEVNIQTDEEDDSFLFQDQNPDSKLLVRVPLFDNNGRVRISVADARPADDNPDMHVVSFAGIGGINEELPVVWHLCRKTWEDADHCEHGDDLSALHAGGERSNVQNLNFKPSGAAGAA